eukprot:7646563-Pyramimonas_sp.AAC.1
MMLRVFLLWLPYCFCQSSLSPRPFETSGEFSQVSPILECSELDLAEVRSVRVQRRQLKRIGEVGGCPLVN